MLFKNLKDALLQRESATGLKLNLTKNEIPYELSSLTNLNMIHISGKKPIKIPSWIKELKKLKSLTIHCPIIEIPVELYYLPELEFLDLSQCELKEFKSPLQCLSPLKNLNLGHNHLKEIPAGIEAFTSIESLYLNDNKITRLTSNLAQLNQLKRLYLDNNQITNIPNFIKEMKDLTILSIDNNPFSDEEKQRIGQVFKIWFE
jgi:Leucine-rich repeat (LRR) protein